MFKIIRDILADLGKRPFNMSLYMLQCFYVSYFEMLLGEGCLGYFLFYCSREMFLAVLKLYREHNKISRVTC